MAEEVSKQDLSGFFAQWLHTTELYVHAIGRVKVGPGSIHSGLVGSKSGGYLTRVEVVRKSPGKFPVRVEVRTGSEGYPPDLETLVEGVTVANDASGRKLKFLRRIPMDPTVGDSEWGLRAYQDKPDSSSWSGQNVYDVYSKNQGTALDGTKYREWD